MATLPADQVTALGLITAANTDPTFIDTYKNTQKFCDMFTNTASVYY